MKSSYQLCQGDDYIDKVILLCLKGCPKTSGKVTQAECKSQESKASCEEQSKRTATSLILFEEVDVIFDDDFGFLAAVKTFMATTKRPVILTTSGECLSV